MYVWLGFGVLRAAEALKVAQGFPAGGVCVTYKKEECEQSHSSEDELNLMSERHLSRDVCQVGS